MKKRLFVALLAALIASAAPASSSETKSDFLPARVISPAAPLFAPGTYRIIGSCHQDHDICAAVFEIMLTNGQLGVRVDREPVEAIVDGEKITLPSFGVRLQVFNMPLGLGETIVVYADRDLPKGSNSLRMSIGKDTPLGQLGMEE